MAKNNYPDPYGKAKSSGLPDIVGPLHIEAEGDKLVPANDMAEVAPEMASGKGAPDPLDLIP